MPLSDRLLGTAVRTVWRISTVLRRCQTKLRPDAGLITDGFGREDGVSVRAGSEWLVQAVLQWASY